MQLKAWFKTNEAIMNCRLQSQGQLRALVYPDTVFITTLSRFEINYKLTIWMVWGGLFNSRFEAYPEESLECEQLKTRTECVNFTSNVIIFGLQASITMSAWRCNLPLVYVDTFSLESIRECFRDEFPDDIVNGLAGEKALHWYCDCRFPANLEKSLGNLGMNLYRIPRLGRYHALHYML